MRKQTSYKIEKEVRYILEHNREYIRRKLIILIERIEYLEGEEFYESIKKDILKYELKKRHLSTLPKAKELQTFNKIK